jgi:hypothetical protein
MKIGSLMPQPLFRSLRAPHPKKRRKILLKTLRCNLLPLQKRRKRKLKQLDQDLLSSINTLLNQLKMKILRNIK